MPVMAATDDVTGSFAVSGIPTVTVTLAPSSMNPQVEQEVTVNVAVPGGLESLTTVVLKVFWENDVPSPTIPYFSSKTADNALLRHNDLDST